ncbi:MAG: class I SAM-dependent methyltransferase [Elusimicrobia bacterium]|nr:class I SAM-dependent methyltransferase [Elusimicrobiota bacterium]
MLRRKVGIFSFWEAKAKNYPLPSDPETLKRTKRIIKLVKKLGVEIKDKSILDIGCGAGIYALPLSHEASKTTGLDSSREMIKKFRKAVISSKAGNVSAIKSDWEKFNYKKYEKRFDISWASMTSAVESAAGIKKMEALSREWCVYIGWAGKRQNPLFKKIYKRHGLEFKAHDGAFRMLEILKKLKRGFKHILIDDSWAWEGTIPEAARDASIYVKLNGKKPLYGWIEDFLKSRFRSGKVRHVTKLRKGLVVWKPTLY